MALPARKAVVQAFGDRGLRLEARALAMLASHVESAADRAKRQAAAAVTSNNDDDGIVDASAAAAAAAADAALSKLLDAYEPGKDRDVLIS